MSEDLLRSARQLLAELDASQTFLRVAASSALDYAGVIRAERRAALRCAALLAASGTLDIQPIDDATEELLVATTKPAVLSAHEAYDDGPEGVADEGNPLLTDEQAMVAHDDEITTDLPISAEPVTEVRAQESSAEEATDAGDLVSFAERDDDTGEVLEYNMDGLIDIPEPSDPVPDVVPEGDHGGLVSFSESGTDGLVTIDEEAPDLSAVLADDDDDLDMLELEDASSEGDMETFHMTRDRVEQEASFVDEEVTMVKAVHAILGEARGEPAQRVTSGLYGGSSVPTIRDANEPRPRAAAVQLNATGTGAEVLRRDDEASPIEVGAAEDYGEEIDEGVRSQGFSVSLQTSERYDEDEYEDDVEDEEVIQAVPILEPTGPTLGEVRALFAQAQEAASNGDLQGGADFYSDVIDADPDHVEAHVARGRLYLDLGDYSRAMSDFMVAEEITAENPEPQVAIGDLYFARKDYRKAIEYFNAALLMAPDHAMAFCRRGISHYYRKNYREALDDLLRAERIDNEIPNIMTYVSMAKKKAKR